MMEVHNMSDDKTAKDKDELQDKTNNWVIDEIIKWLELFMPVTIAKKIVCLILIAMRIHRFAIAENTGVSDRTIRTLQKAVKEKQPIDSLLTIKNGRGRKSKLTDVEAEIIQRIEEGQFETRSQVVQMIKDEFGIEISVATAGRILKKNGYRKLKCGSLPAKADTQKQRDFYDTVIRPLMEKAKTGAVRLLFLDASHFVHGCDFLGRIYCKVRRFIKTFSGRNRYNVLGTLDFITHKMITVVNETYITATEVCEMLRKLASHYPGEKIHLILDNARYQKCKVVQAVAEELGIILEYLPPYSPALNLIERCWKFVKSELRSRYFSDFQSFKDRIDSIIASLIKENRDRINSLLGEKVQLFDNLQQVSANTYAAQTQAA